MDPSAATWNRKKRKNISPIAHEKAKRFISGVHEGQDFLNCGRSSCSPSLTVLNDRLQQSITLDELMELLHYAALGKRGGIKQPSWCRLRHQKRIKSINVVMVEGLTQSHFYKHYLILRHLRTNYTTRVTFTPSSLDLASGIFNSEVPKSDVSSLCRSHGESNQIHKALMTHPVITKFGTQRRGLTAYVLSHEEMIKRHYPVRGIPGFEEFVSTDSVDCLTDRSPLYGLDCEMCLTETGYELARVSLVDPDGSCVMDELVKPQRRILDYLTRFSGITAAMLQPITTNLRDVQAKLRMLLPSDAVLVGHSLNNDLIALKLIHQHVIDTSLLYRREFGQRFKLKVLSETVLKKQIQTEEKMGHNPTEDAAAALELAQYFIKTGPRQVVELHLEELWGYSLVEEPKDCEPAPTLSHSFADILQTVRRSVAFFGKRSNVALDLSNQMWHNSDKEVLASFRRQPSCPFLSVLQFPFFSDHHKKYLPPLEQRYHRVCASLRDMCVVFAGPFPVGFSAREVKRLFRCFGPVEKIKILNTTVRVHAEIMFKLLESAMLALKTLNGQNLHGEHIKVQRPVNETMLDLDLTLDALMVDRLNTNNLYAVKMNPIIAECMNFYPKSNGQTPVIVNGTHLRLTAKEAKLSQQTVTETFAHFGTVERVLLPAKPGKHPKYAHIQFDTSDDKHAALCSSEYLQKKNYIICPALTPPHLASWVAKTMPATIEGSDRKSAENEERTHMSTSCQDQEMDLMMRKLDRRLQKLFKSLPDGTLSVVVLPGQTSAQGHIPGLCLMEVKRGS